MLVRSRRQPPKGNTWAAEPSEIESWSRQRGNLSSIEPTDSNSLADIQRAAEEEQWCHGTERWKPVLAWSSALAASPRQPQPGTVRPGDTVLVSCDDGFLTAVVRAGSIAQRKGRSSPSSPPDLVILHLPGPHEVDPPVALLRPRGRCPGIGVPVHRSFGIVGGYAGEAGGTQLLSAHLVAARQRKRPGGRRALAPAGVFRTISDHDPGCPAHGLIRIWDRYKKNIFTAFRLFLHVRAGHLHLFESFKESLQGSAESGCT